LILSPHGPLATTPDEKPSAAAPHFHRWSCVDRDWRKGLETRSGGHGARRAIPPPTRHRDRAPAPRRCLASRRCLPATGAALRERASTFPSRFRPRPLAFHRHALASSHRRPPSISLADATILAEREKTRRCGSPRPPVAIDRAWN